MHGSVQLGFHHQHQRARQRIVHAAVEFEARRKAEEWARAEKVFHTVMEGIRYPKPRQVIPIIELPQESSDIPVDFSPSLRTILQATADYYGLRAALILGYRRTSHLVRARHMAMYLAYSLTARTMPEIGRAFKRDHTTVHHAVHKMMDHLTEPEIATEITAITAAVAR